MQRQLWLRSLQVAVSYTTAVETLPAWRDSFERYLDDVEVLKEVPAR